MLRCATILDLLVVWSGNNGCETCDKTLCSTCIFRAFFPPQPPTVRARRNTARATVRTLLDSGHWAIIWNTHCLLFCCWYCYYDYYFRCLRDASRPKGGGGGNHLKLWRGGGGTVIACPLIYCGLFVFFVVFDNDDGYGDNGWMLSMPITCTS